MRYWPEMDVSKEENIEVLRKMVELEQKAVVRKSAEIDRLWAENAELRKQLMNNSPGTTSDGGQKAD